MLHSFLAASLPHLHDLCAPKGAERLDGILFDSIFALCASEIEPKFYSLEFSSCLATVSANFRLFSSHFTHATP